MIIELYCWACWLYACASTSGITSKLELFEGDGSLSAQNLGGEECRLPTAVCVRKLERLSFYVVWKCRQYIVLFRHKAHVTDRRTVVSPKTALALLHCTIKTNMYDLVQGQMSTISLSDVRRWTGGCNTICSSWECTVFWWPLDYIEINRLVVSTIRMMRLLQTLWRWQMIQLETNLTFCHMCDLHPCMQSVPVASDPVIWLTD